MNGNLIHIVAVSYGRLSSILRKLEPTLSANVRLTFVEGVLDEVKPEIMRLEANGEVDILLSSGGNARHLAMYAKTPIVEIEVTGFDFLSALREARRFSEKVCVVTNLQKIPLVSELADILRVTLYERTYNQVLDLDYVLDEMREAGVLDIVGSSLIIERARMKGMRGHYIYSEHGAGEAITRAIQMAGSMKSEGRSLRLLHGILKNTLEGIVSVDANGVINVFNPSAEKILGLTREQAIGRKCDAALPGFDLMDTVVNNREKPNLIRQYGGRRLLTNQVPIPGDNKAVSGALLTFHAIDSLRFSDGDFQDGQRHSARHSLSDIICKSNRMLHLKKLAHEFAVAAAPILIWGGTGTGKSMFAHGIHNAGPRASKPFVTLNCSALGRGEQEAALFGESGLSATRFFGGGALGAAAGGTLYLDSVEDLELEAQGKLVRCLELWEAEENGREKQARIVASTSRDLAQLVESRAFRGDLYHRLNVLSLTLPGLIDRQPDIPLLMTRFLEEKYPELTPGKIKTLAGAPFLAKHSWPGNVRELRNLVERFALAGKSSSDHLRLIQTLLSGGTEHIGDADILRVLESNSGNRNKTAEALNISRSTLWRKLKEMGAE